MGTTWGTAGRAAPTVSTEWLSATLGTLQNCPFPPPALLRTPPAPLRATQHCSGHTRIACSPPALLRTPSALLRMPPAQPILPQHISGPPGPLSIAQDPPPAHLRTPQNCPFSPSTAQDAPSTTQDHSELFRTPQALPIPYQHSSDPPPQLPSVPQHISGLPQHRPFPPPSTVFAAFSPLWSRSVPREGPQAATSPCGAEAGRPQGERGLLRGIIGQGRAMLRQNTDGGPTRGGVGSVKGFAVLRRPHGDTEERNSALLRPLPQAAQAAWRTQRRAPPSRL